jgi:hypothetical protein
MGRYTGLWRADSRFLPLITVFPACSVHIGWDATVKANDGFSVFNTVAKARVVWVRRDRHQTGGALRWKS